MKPLTFDEKQAAEAAFRGLPYDPAWGQAAWAVYAGILAVMMERLARPRRRA